MTKKAATKPKKSRTSIWLENDLRARLDRRAAKTNMSLARTISDTLRRGQKARPMPPLKPSLDDLRALRPDLSFALFAMEPGEDVTFEIYHDGHVYPFHGATVADAILAAFPPAKTEEPTPTAPETSVFD